MITINPTCVVCWHSSEIYGRWECNLNHAHEHKSNAATTTCCQHEYKKYILAAKCRPLQDPATKCTDPADKDAVIRDLRIEKNGLLCIINSIRGDAEAAHKSLEHIRIRMAKVGTSSGAIHSALDAIENIIESIGVKIK